MTYLGEEGDLDADVYQLEWLGGKPPSEWRANRLVRMPATVRNASSATWPARGATRVAVAYHWLDTAGQAIIFEGLRSALPPMSRPVEPSSSSSRSRHPESPATTFSSSTPCVSSWPGSPPNGPAPPCASRSPSCLPTTANAPCRTDRPCPIAAVDPTRQHPPAEALDTPGGLLRSSGAATLAQFVRVAAILLTHLALRRLIPPADWGLRDWAEALFLLLATVRDLGLPSHVVRLRPIPLGNLLRVQLAWGGILGLALLVGAPVLAGTFRTPRPDVALVLQVMVVYLLLEGLASVPLTHFEAGLRIGRSVVPELARTLSYCIGALALALAGWGVWSFVLAMIGSQAIYAALLWQRARPTMVLHFEPGETSRCSPPAFRWGVSGCSPSR